MNLRWFGLWFCCIALLGAGCRPGSSPERPLRIAVLPILDTLPLYVAEAEGLFAERDLSIVFVSAASAAERDQLLQAGQVDGVITDLVALALYNRHAPQVAAVRFAMVPTSRSPQFRILAAPGSMLDGAADLRGVPIGISEGTVIEYVTRHILVAEGLAASDVTFIAVPNITDRMALLNSGELQAATLPEPLASLAVEQGARVLVDDGQHPEASASLFGFRLDVIQERPEAVRAFVAAVSEASRRINRDPTRWDSLLTEKQLIPPALAGRYALPDYPGDLVPAVEQFAAAVAWLQELGRLGNSPDYGAVVRADFLPPSVEEAAP